jgi:hypothetical protein
MLAGCMALAIKLEHLRPEGVFADFAELARLGFVTRARMPQIMNLLLLAPAIQEEILFLPPTRPGSAGCGRGTSGRSQHAWSGTSSAASGASSSRRATNIGGAAISCGTTPATAGSSSMLVEVLNGHSWSRGVKPDSAVPRPLRAVLI